MIPSMARKSASQAKPSIMSGNKTTASMPTPGAATPTPTPSAAQETKRGDNTLTGGDKAKLKEVIGQRESGGDYRIRNDIGYSGKYQFGAMALEDVGLLKGGAHKLGRVKTVLDNIDNWKLKGGLGAFLSNQGLQEKSMDRLMRQNLSVLKGAPGFENFDKSNVAGAMAAAHLVGAGGAKKFLAGTDSADAYGTKASDYFELGKNAIAAAKGFSGMVDRPTLFLTGEKGPEDVRITPRSDLGMSAVNESAIKRELNGAATSSPPPQVIVADNSGSSGNASNPTPLVIPAPSGADKRSFMDRQYG